MENAMYSDFTYKDELYKLIDDENNFDFFRSILKEQTTYNPEHAKYVLDTILKFSKENNMVIPEAWAYYYFGWYYINLSDYDTALNSFLEANELFEKNNYKQGLIFICNGLNSLYCLTGQFSLSSEWGLKGISLSEETDNKDALVTLLINTGINYIQMKDFNMAKEVLTNIVMNDYELTNLMKVSVKLSLAEIEINIGKPETALRYIRDAEVLEHNTEISSNTSEICKLKGMAYSKLGNYDLAEIEFMKSYDIANVFGYNHEKCYAIIEWSKLSIKKGQSIKAISLLNESVNISKSSNFNVLLKESSVLLYETYKEIGNSEKALFHLEEYIRIDEEIYDYEQNQLMVKLKFKHAKMEASLYKLLYDKTELLSNIGQKIISNLNFNSIIEIISKEINSLINSDTFGIAIYDIERNMVEYYFVDESDGSTESMTLDMDDNSFASYCIKNRKDIIINDVSKEYTEYINSLRYSIVFKDKPLEKSMIYTPLIINDNAVGVMTVQSYNTNAYDKNDLNTLKIIANYASIAIDNANSYKRIESIATYDAMTGFLTRFEIIRLGEMIYKKYMDDKKAFSVIMIDIDDFKVINDTFGHVCGDRAIAMLTDTISRCIRTNDYIGRYGGDEFLLICPGLSQNEAFDVAERIRSVVSGKAYLIDENVLVNITISLGIYEFGSNELSFIDGVKEADKYLYHAKKSSKNRVACNLLGKC